MSGFSRRQLLKAMGALGVVSVAGAAALRPRTARAQTGVTDESIAGFSRFKLGNMELTVISDGSSPFDASILGVNAPEGGIDAALSDSGISMADNTVSYLILLARAGDEWVLFDTGNGNKLVPTLGALGIAPGDIDKVVISHFHPDHINGMVTDGAPTFPNATYHFPALEREFLNADLSATPLAGIAGLALSNLAAVESQLSLYNDGDVLAEGITAQLAAGHSAGHMAFKLESEGRSLLHLVDAALSAYVSLPHPDWFSGFDADGPMASQTRIALLEQSMAENSLILGYHFPFPGVGYVRPEGDGYRFVPAAF
jgi:glyoxylase-like metal-dependent hydrolase (beta-lactamase superfamily II)